MLMGLVAAHTWDGITLSDVKDSGKFSSDGVRR
jgi:hypothetical protein